MTLRIAALCGIIYKWKGRGFCPVIRNVQCFCFFLASSSWCRFPRRSRAQPLLCSSVGSTLLLKPWDLGTAPLRLIAWTVLGCPGVSSSHAPCTRQHTAVRLVTHLSAVSGYRALLWYCSSVDICSACLPFMLTHSSAHLRVNNWSGTALQLLVSSCPAEYTHWVLLYTQSTIIKPGHSLRHFVFLKPSQTPIRLVHVKRCSFSSNWFCWLIPFIWVPSAYHVIFKVFPWFCLLSQNSSVGCHCPAALVCCYTHKVPSKVQKA